MRNRIPLPNISSIRGVGIRSPITTAIIIVITSLIIAIVVTIVESGVGSADGGGVGSSGIVVKRVCGVLIAIGLMLMRRT